ncbi:BEL homeodomain protein 1 [Spatholobus suberectus]|nr:BEL homeodomain protein 1 [Spatholobus suberectus]
MATYFHGSTSEIPSSAEGLQTLYLMNPNYVPYSDAAQHPTQNMLLVNPNTSNTSPTPANALNLANFSHAPPPPSPNNHREQHLIGVTIPSSNILGSAADPARPSFLGQHEFSGFHGGAAAATTAVASRAHYNLWGSSIIDQPASDIMAVSVNTPSSSIGCVAGTASVSTQIGFHRPNHLSLSLSSQQTPYRSLSGEVQAISPASRGGEDMRGVYSMHSVVVGSNYLKAAQELLDEVVNVGKGISKGKNLWRGLRKRR